MQGVSFRIIFVPLMLFLPLSKVRLSSYSGSLDLFLVRGSMLFLTLRFIILCINAHTSFDFHHSDIPAHTLQIQYRQSFENRSIMPTIHVLYVL